MRRVRILLNSVTMATQFQMQTSNPTAKWLQPSYLTASFTLLIVPWGSAAVIIFQAAYSLGAAPYTHLTLPTLLPG